MVTGMPAQQMHPAQVGTIVQPMATPSTNTSKGMRITNGIFGMIMSLALIGYSLLCHWNVGRSLARILKKTWNCLDFLLMLMMMLLIFMME